MAQSPHKPYNGCQLCSPHKNQRQGRARREPFAVLRAIGKSWRERRGDLGEVADW